MKSFSLPVAIRTSAMLLAAAVLAGCASSGASLTAKGGHAPPRADADYMNIVEQTARNRGVRVVWVNPPGKPGTPIVGRLD